MLVNRQNIQVIPKQRGAAHMEDGFCVSHKRDHSFLKPLREVKAVLAHKCGKLFRLETRARIVEKKS